MELEAYGHSKISIHALREEGDQRWQCVSVDGLGFLSTPSARRATAINLGSGAMRGDFYPRPPRGGRRRAQRRFRGSKGISIHALREEGDLDSWHYGDNYTISIHALREEGDHYRSELTS